MEQNLEYSMHFFQNRCNRARKIWKRPGTSWTSGKAGAWSKSNLTLKNRWGERESSHRHLGRKTNVSLNTETAGMKISYFFKRFKGDIFFPTICNSDYRNALMHICCLWLYEWIKKPKWTISLMKMSRDYYTQRCIDKAMTPPPGKSIWSIFLGANKIWKISFTLYVCFPEPPASDCCQWQHTRLDGPSFTQHRLFLTIGNWNIVTVLTFLLIWISWLTFVMDSLLLVNTEIIFMFLQKTYSC